MLKESISSQRSYDLNKQNLDDIILFIKNYVKAFAMKVTSTSFIKTFELELIRWIKYLLKFGLFVYRDNTFQTEDIDFIFSYLWHILDIYTGRNYVKSYK